MEKAPGKSWDGPLPPLTAAEAVLRDDLKTHVRVLAGEIGERSTSREGSLARAAGYVAQVLEKAGFAVAREEFSAGGTTVANLVVTIPGAGRPEEIILMGAHYDSVPGSPGADDNASGVAALLEMARSLAGQRFARTIRLVAFVNEEPPWFKTEQMGSRVHARNAASRGEKIVAMYSLETIGFYRDARGSQSYPPPLDRLFPDTGNFIGFVADHPSRDLLRRAIATFRETTRFPAEGVAAPAGITGVDWSDQWSFWQEGYRALMITDTAPFRYPHYHRSSDTPDRLDYERMARVVAGISRVVIREAAAVKP